MDNSNDKLLAALTYPIPLIGIVILISDSMKNNPYLRVHAVQSLVMGVSLWVVSTILISAAGIGCLLGLATLALTIYYAIQVYNGKEFTIPFVTDFCKNQKWI